MKIEKIRIENFRSFEDETIVLDNYNCFVGSNGSGKSTVLSALNVFFRNTSVGTNITNMTEEDFHNRNTDKQIAVTVWFVDLCESAKEELSAYVRQDRLIVSAKAKWCEISKSATVDQFGSRLINKDFAVYFEADKAKESAANLKEIYADICKKYSDLPSVKTKGDMLSALRTYEEEHPETCELSESNDQFYGFSKGGDKLAKYCQWVYIPAVKDASDEQQESRGTALGELLQRTIRTKVSFDENLQALRDETVSKYQDILDGQTTALAEVSSLLGERLKDWSHPGANVDLYWHNDPSKSVVLNDPLARIRVGEGGFLGELQRLGHGLQRSFIVSLLHELSSSEGVEGPTLVLGFEEPELYQHPPQARHLSSLLEALSTGNTQVILTTHSPYFVSGKGFESVRMFLRGQPDGATKVTSLGYDELSKLLAEALGCDPVSPTSIMAAVEQILQPSQNEMFFTKVPVLVEGVEDVAYIATYLQLKGKWSEFRKYGCHFIVANGKGPMSRPLAIAKGLNIPVFTVFDGDNHKEKKERNYLDNKCLLGLAGHTDIDNKSEEPIFEDNFVMWGSTIGNVVKAEIGEESWGNSDAKVRDDFGFTDGVKGKNSLLITAILEDLWASGNRSESLEKLCDAIIDHASKFH